MATSFYVDHLTHSQLQTLTEYKYRGEDRSLTYKYILGPLYARLIHLLPLWMAPNLVTFLGFLITISGHILLMYHAPTFDTPAPSSVYIYSGLALFVYMVLDNLDGKQARRTRSSSPLGHLFDHGCDSLNVTLAGMSVLASVQLGSGAMSASLLYFLGHLPAFTANLEEYFTGCMILRELNGPNEGIITLCSFQLAAGIMGPSFWKSTFHIPGAHAFTLQLNHIAYLFAFFPVLNSTMGNVIAVLRHLRASGKSFPAALFSLFLHTASIILFGFCLVAWSILSPAHFRRQLLIIMWLSGAVLFDLISRVILAHLTGAPFPFMPRLFIPFVFAACNAMICAKFGVSLGDPDQVTLLALFIVVTYCAWRIWCLITQLCDFLNVKCFSLGKLHHDRDDAE